MFSLYAYISHLICSKNFMKVKMCNKLSFFLIDLELAFDWI